MFVSIVNFISFWFFSGIFYVLDVVCYKHCSKRKIIPQTCEQISKLYTNSFLIVFINQCISTLFLFVYENVAYDSNEDWGFNFSITLVIKFPALYFITSFLLTLFHIFFHRYTYWIHKKHHEHQAPIGLTALYASKREWIITLCHGIFSLYLLQLIHLKLARFEVALGLIVYNLQLICGHSGYNFIHISRYHNVHHQNPNKRYADSEWMERAFKFIF